jgi:4-amino-4-deoxy-L-arabinose transferase-like glycosyltransferase
MAALLLALVAQFLLETLPINPIRHPRLGLSIYIPVILLIFWAWQKGEISLASLPVAKIYTDEMDARWGLATVALAVLLLSFFLFKGNQFNLINLTVWLLGLGLLVRAFWERAPGRSAFREKLRQRIQNPLTGIKFTSWMAILLLATGLVVFFRVYRLADIPSEPYSDHAEKLLDVYDVLHGKTSIFFERNTGREAIQFYLTALVAILSRTGVSFMSLKIGTALAGIATLPFIYLLGKELGGRRAGLLALILAGIAYWGNVISRIGLRYTLFPLFAAATLFFLFRGLRRSSRNDIIIAGLLLGLGLHGYTAFRIMPFVVLIAFALYWLHPQSRGMRMQSAFWFGLAILMALMVYLPLLRYTLENPQSVVFRTLTRLTGAEQAISDPVWQILLFNLGRALAMPFWNNGGIWAHSVMNRPALDLVSAALLLPGVTLVLARYGRRRDWRDIFLILSIPMLMLPSILSIAFPEENPSLNRTSAAIIPIFIVIALCLDGVMSSFEHSLRDSKGAAAAWGLAFMLVAFACWQNYDLVFRQYDQQYRFFDWNSTDMGGVVHEFLDSGNTMQQVFVLEYPYWVDSRLVAIAAGHPETDPIFERERLFDTLKAPRPLIFLMHQDDSASLDILTLLYPQGILNRYTSDTPRHDFWVFFVPAVSSNP